MAAFQKLSTNRIELFQFLNQYPSSDSNYEHYMFDSIQ